MSTAEITAYLKGVEVGRQADRDHVPPQGVPLGIRIDATDPLYQSWQRLGEAEFRRWVYRGVWDAWKQ